MTVRITYNDYKPTEDNPVGLIKVTNDFKVKQYSYGYILENGWYVSYKYSEESEWEITKDEEYISLCEKPIIIEQ